jgi:hypothetical protein
MNAPRRSSRHSRRSMVELLLTMLVAIAATGGAVRAQDPSAPAAPATTAVPAAPVALPGAAGRLVDLIGSMEADRLLLVELRKDLPSTRQEAEQYLARVEDLALTSDPERLGVIVSRVRAAAPDFLDWRDQPYQTQAEASAAYIQTGAAAFDTTWNTLQDAILLTVANRLDTIIGLVDDIQGGR